MTTQQLINALANHANGLRTPDILIYDEKGNEFEVVRVYEEDGFTCIDVERQDGVTLDR